MKGTHKRKLFGFTLVALLVTAGGCGIIDGVKGAIDDAKKAAADLAIDAALEAAKAGGAVAEVIRDFDVEYTVSITDPASSANGAAIFIPAGAIDGTDVDAVIVSIKSLYEATDAPRDATYVAVGPTIDFSLQAASLDAAGKEINLLLPVVLSLPFSASNVLTGETAIAAQLILSPNPPTYSTLGDQELDEANSVVKGSTPHLSTYGAVVERELPPEETEETPPTTNEETPPPASIEGLASGKMHAKAVSPDTSLFCDDIVAGPGNYTLIYEAPTVANPPINDMGELYLEGQTDPGTPFNFYLYVMDMPSFVPIAAPLDIKTAIGSTQSMDFALSCASDSNFKVNAYLSGDTTINRIEIIKIISQSTQTDVPCSAFSTSTCNITSGSALVFWDVSAVTSGGASPSYPAQSGQVRGYVTLPFKWRERTSSK